MPYIAVLDTDNTFYGILTHARLLDMLSSAWNIKTGAYVLTVLSTNDSGNLTKMTKIIAKFVNLAGAMTLDAPASEFDGKYVRRTLFTLPQGTTETELKAICKKLKAKGFPVVAVEDLAAGMNIMSEEKPGVFLNEE